MSERKLLVYVDLDGVPAVAGALWTRSRGPRATASFEYDAGWLWRPDAFALDPELPLVSGPAHTPRPMWNAFTDPAPDRWGQRLLRRHEVRQARRDQRTPRTLQEIDFLTLVDDQTRLGALRFKEVSQGAWLSSGSTKVPPLIELPRLLRATTRILADEDTDDDLRLVLAPGTSLGGARPKASIVDRGGHLAIAKFPSSDDTWPVTRWEATTLALAKAAGVEVPEARLELVLRRPVLVLRRFDREGRVRVPFMSALTALGAADGDRRSYLELAGLLRQQSPSPRGDLLQLWRRVVFNVLVSNTDDHLRNHGFLREGGGWTLAPAYDLNPTPTDVKDRSHALALDEGDPTASLETALAMAPQFGLSGAEARRVAGEVGEVVAGWRKVAARHGLTAAQIDRMESAFEHADLAAARSFASAAVSRRRR